MDSNENDSDERDDNNNTSNNNINVSNKQEDALDNMRKPSLNDVVNNNKMIHNRDKVLTADALKPLNDNKNTNNRTPSIDDNIESSSSTSGKSGSGIGYNADYSASDDQSSDDTSREQRELQQMLRKINKIEINNNNSDSSFNSNDNKCSNVNNRESDIVRDNTKKQYSKRTSHNKRNENIKQQVDDNESILILKKKSSRGASARDNCQRSMVDVVEGNEAQYSSFHPHGSIVDKESGSSSHWNGIHITNPMDPRLELLSAQQIQSLSSNNVGYPKLVNDNSNVLTTNNINIPNIQQGNGIMLVDQNHYGGGGLEGLYGFTTTTTNSNAVVQQTTTVQHKQQQPIQQSHQLNSLDGQSADIGLSYENYMRLLEVSKKKFM